MDSSTGGGASSNSSSQQKAVSDLENVVDLRKRKRMISNRDSARRSRARKKKHQDDLVAEVAALSKENDQFLTGLNATTQNFYIVESDNAILRAQVAELSHRLQSLEDITSFLGGGFATEYEAPAAYGVAAPTGFSGGLWNLANHAITTAGTVHDDPVAVFLHGSLMAI